MPNVQRSLQSQRHHSGRNIRRLYPLREVVSTELLCYAILYKLIVEMSKVVDYCNVWGINGINLRYQGMHYIGMLI